MDFSFILSLVWSSRRAQKENSSLSRPSISVVLRCLAIHKHKSNQCQSQRLPAVQSSAQTWLNYLFIFVGVEAGGQIRFRWLTRITHICIDALIPLFSQKKSSLHLPGQPSKSSRRNTAETSVSNRCWRKRTKSTSSTSLSTHWKSATKRIAWGWGRWGERSREACSWAVQVPGQEDMATLRNQATQHIHDWLHSYQTSMRRRRTLTWS